MPICGPILEENAMLLGQPVNQLAYLVKDVREAALRHSALFGSGPFFAIEYPVLKVIHRGREAIYSHSVALGQWGTMQLELLQNNGDGPSILEDMYPKASGRTGLHHMAIFVKDLEEAVATFKQQGYPEAMRVSRPSGLNVSFLDTVSKLGHFVELYEPRPAHIALRAELAKAAQGFDGSRPLHEAHVDLDTFKLTIKS
jgi:hypothetical protein